MKTENRWTWIVLSALLGLWLVNCLPYQQIAEAQTPRVITSWNTNQVQYDNTNGMMSLRSGLKGTNVLLYGGGHYVPALVATNSGISPSNGVIRASSTAGNQYMVEDPTTTRLWTVENVSGPLRFSYGIKDAAGGLSNKTTSVSITPTNTLTLSVGLQYSIIQKAVNYTNLPSETAVFMDATAAVITNTLPSATNNTGLLVYVTKTDLGANSVWVVPNGAETLRSAIGLVSAWPLNGGTNTATWISTGTNWVQVTGGR